MQICTTEISENFAKQELQHHQSLNKKLSFEDKIIPKNRAITLGVSERFKDRYIIDSINRILSLNADEN